MISTATVWVCLGYVPRISVGTSPPPPLPTPVHLGGCVGEARVDSGDQRSTHVNAFFAPSLWVSRVLWALWALHRHLFAVGAGLPLVPRVRAVLKTNFWNPSSCTTPFWPTPKTRPRSPQRLGRWAYAPRVPLPPTILPSLSVWGGPMGGGVCRTGMCLGSGLRDRGSG